MFGKVQKRMREKLEERRKAKEAIYREEHPEWYEVSFCLQDVEFMGYYLPMNLSACGNELSLYEADEKSFNEEVCMIFREIAEELTEGYHVLQWIRWSSVQPMPAIKKYKAGEGAIFDEHFIVKCTENGTDPLLMELQMGEGNEWQFTEQECYCYLEKLLDFAAVEDATEYIEKVPCDLYIMLDLEHAAMMVKTRKTEDLKIVEICMRKICEKYEKKIYDYIGHDWTQKST